MRHNGGSRVAVALALALVSCLIGAVQVQAQVDGVVRFDQTAALAGNVTPGDLPGFPVTISRSGSYRLTGNLQVVDRNTTAIEITADDVTLDLNGFVMQGAFAICSGRIQPVWCLQPGSGGSGSGVVARKAGSPGPDRSNIAVVNGTVRAMGYAGLLLGPRARVEKVNVSQNRTVGISVREGSIVSDNIVVENGFIGIVALSSVVVGNTVEMQGYAGIFGTTAIACASNALYSIEGSAFLRGEIIQTGFNSCNGAQCQ